MSRTVAWGTKFGALGALSTALMLVGGAPPPSLFAENPDHTTYPMATSAVVRHITLEASLPEDDQTVNGDVTEVRLFFSDAPLMRGASIRVVNSSRRLVRSSPPEADADDPKQLAVQLAPALPPGRYVVQWRCIADDGHVMRGDFTFEVVRS